LFRTILRLGKIGINLSSIQLMDVTVSVVNEHNTSIHTKLDNTKFQKMVLLFNSLEDGWSVKKRGDSYVFTKKHEGKKEVLEESYLMQFMKTHLDFTRLQMV
jgi:hypothetical protein